jgi:glycosyltransferase involved in cell wall biosynthesis
LGQIFEDKVRDLGDVSGAFFRITPALDRTQLDGFDLEKRLSGNERRSRIMFLARLERKKGAHIAIETLERIRERHPERDYRLWIVGDGPEYQALRGMVADRGIEGAVFTGRISDVEKYELLKAVDIFIFPTCYGEGLPAVLLEAMLCGLPVISRPVGAIAEQIEHGVNGLLTEAETADRFAEYVLRLTDGREEYDAMARANFQKAAREYASEVVRERLLGIYAAVLAA